MVNKYELHTVTHAANGTDTTFPFNFVIPDGRIIVTIGTSRELAVDYTVNGYNDPGGGVVVFATAPADGTVITISRRVSGGYNGGGSAGVVLPEEVLADVAQLSETVTSAVSEVTTLSEDIDQKYTTIQTQWPVISMAEAWADTNEDIEVIQGTGRYSAKHWSAKARAAVLSVRNGTTVISESDAAPGPLGDKLKAGDGITITVDQAGAVPAMIISNTNASASYISASTTLTQNASIVLATPAIKDGDGLKRTVSVFEETVGSILSDSATDFDIADAAQFVLRNRAPNTAVSLVGNEQTSPVTLLSSDANNVSTSVSSPLDDDGSRAVIVAYDPVSAATKAYVVIRLGPGSYSVGVPVTLTSGQIGFANLLRMNATTVVLTYRTTNTPYVYYARVITVDGGGAITLGTAQVLRNSGYTYGTPRASCCRISDTEFCAAVIDIIPNGGNQYVNYARVTLSGTVLTVGTWKNLVTTTDAIGGTKAALVSPGVVALLWSQSGTTTYWNIRLLDVTTNPYTLGGNALSSDINYYDRMLGVVSLSDTQFAVLSGGVNNTNYWLYGKVYNHVGTETPAYVSSTSFMSGVGVWHLDVQQSIVRTGVNKYRAHVLSDGGVYNKVYYIDFSLSPSNKLSVDATQSIAITGTYYGGYPSTFIQAADGYVWTLAPRTSDYTYVAFEYRPSLSATLGSGSWAASDVGRAVVVGGGVAKIISIDGATADLLTISAINSVREYASGTWKLQDAALYNGYVYNLSGAPAVITTVKDSSLWETMTGMSASYSSGALLAWSFDDGHNWVVWSNSAVRTIVSDQSSVHGGADNSWMYHATDAWAYPPENSSQSALECAFAVTNNQVSPNTYSSIGTAGFAALGFIKSIRGKLGVAMLLPTTSSWFNQLTVTYIGRSAWKRADNNYSIDFGREDRITVIRTASGSATVRVVSTL